MATEVQSNKERERGEREGNRGLRCEDARGIRVFEKSIVGRGGCPVKRLCARE